MESRHRLAVPRTLTFPAVLAFTFLLGPARQQDEADGWPRELDTPEGTVVIYQPQLESFQGNELRSRAAVSYTETGETEPVFGAVWITARVETDREQRTVTVLDIKVNNVRFPEATDEDEDRFARFLELEVPKWELSISLDRVLTGLELAETEREASEQLNHDPPIVVFASDPAILVTIDGEPRLQSIEGSDHMRVINTPYTIVFSSDDRAYYLYAGKEQWYRATEIKGAWELTGSVPGSVSALAPPQQELVEEGDAPEETEPGPPPRIVVATVPTELIVIQGEPEYTPIEGTGLLYMANTEDDILLEIESQSYYVVLSGRWYSSESLEGPWTYVTGDALPGSFAEIPPESQMGHLLVSVPGTDEANEAVLENQIPQTAAVDREATLDVTYDGEPQFEPVEDADLEYAANTATSVIRVDGRYYACDEAVWFVADSPHGPWVVADYVPQSIYTQPPSSPVYNVKYVYVYDSTPDVVYVGYYPGYTGSYVYYGTIVYGTGYYYRPWYGTVYYARPATWGFHVRWNPWYGWSFGFSYSTGPFHFHMGWGGWHHHGWWGPVGYRGYRYGYHRGWHHGYRAGARAGYRHGYYAGRRDAARNNIYRTQRNSSRAVTRSQQATRQQPRASQGRQNNVYTDRSGNVYRRGSDGNWQQRDRSVWQPSTPSARDRSGTANRSQLDRSAQQRQRGTARTNNFQRSTPSRSRSGGRRR
jgi:hypothetical protein